MINFEYIFNNMVLDFTKKKKQKKKKKQLTMQVCI